jgi:hypothetical protein
MCRTVDRRRIRRRPIPSPGAAAEIVPPSDDAESQSETRSLERLASGGSPGFLEPPIRVELMTYAAGAACAARMRATVVGCHRFPRAGRPFSFRVSAIARIERPCSRSLRMRVRIRCSSGTLTNRTPSSPTRQIGQRQFHHLRKCPTPMPRKSTSSKTHGAAKLDVIAVGQLVLQRRWCHWRTCE